MEHHEYANLFPMLPDAELRVLSEDIKASGQQSPITTYEGKILDGRNRFRACQLAGVEPIFEEYTGSDALQFVISHNLHRRHLTESQRAIVAAKWAGLKHGSNQKQKKQESPIGDSSQSETKTRDEAAKMLSIGTSSIDRAKRVMKSAPELIEKIERGEMTVNAAAEIAKAKTPKPEPAQQDEPETVVEDARKAPRIPKWIPDDAERLWLLAKTHLDKVLPTDKSRERVFRDAIAYLQNRIDNHK